MNQGLQFLSLTWTDGILDNEAIMIVREVHVALRQANMFLPASNVIALPEVKPFGYWILQGFDPDAPYCSTEWYIKQSYDKRRSSLLGWRYLNVVLNEPYQYHSPHYDLAVMHYPLYDEKLGRRVFGVAIPGHAAVVSNDWLGQLSANYFRPIVLRRLIAHYLGQVLGIPFPDSQGRIPCSGPCAMRPALELQEWVEKAEEEFRAETIYCEACRRQLGARIASNQMGLN